MSYRLSAFLLLVSVFLGGAIYFYFSMQKVPLTTPQITGLTETPFAPIRGAVVTPPPPSASLGKVIDSKKVEEFTPEQITKNHISFFTLSPGIKPQYTVERHTMSFVSQDKAGQPITIFSQIYIPKLPKGTKLPVYVFGSGTTGLDDHCAPSKENAAKSNWGNYSAHMIAYASQGYIVVFPDYEGFNDPARIHHYFIGQLEAQVLLDGARAARDYFKQSDVGIETEDQIFFAGYSEGGHAAFGVKDIAKEYAPDIPIKGVIGYGPTSNIEALLRENPALAPYLIFAYADYYGIDNFDPKNYLQERWLSNLESDVLGMCIDGVTGFYGSDPSIIYKEEFMKALYAQDLQGAGYQKIKGYFDENSTGYSKSEIPMLILQGGIDPIVKPSTQKEFMRIACESGNTITYQEFTGIHHFQTRQASFKETLQWMKDLRDGKQVRNDCTA